MEEEGTITASKRASPVGVFAPILSIFQMSPMTVMVSRSLHHEAFGPPPMCLWVDSFLGPEIHSLPLSSIRVKVSRTPHVISRFSFSFMSPVYVTVSRPPLPILHGLPLWMVVSRSPYRIFHSSPVPITTSRPLLPLLIYVTVSRTSR